MSTDATQTQIVAATLIRRVCQLFDSGGESMRSHRARCAEAAFRALHRDEPAYREAYDRCDRDPDGFVRQITLNEMTDPDQTHRLDEIARVAAEADSQARAELT